MPLRPAILSTALMLLAACGQGLPASAGKDASIKRDGGAIDAAKAEDAEADPLDAAGFDTGPDAGCSDANLPDGGGTPVLDSVTPASAGASVGALVTLRGTGFGPVARVEVGGLAASDIEVLDGSTLRARFPPVPLTDLGPKGVRVVLGSGAVAELPAGFEYLFDEDPVVFVHGYMGNGGQFDAMRARFRAAGYPADQLFAISFADAYGSNVTAAGELATFVADVLRRTGAPKVDLVTHSMGGVSARLFVKQRGGAALVRDFVSLAGSHHGAFMWWPVGDGGREMATTYACRGEALNDVQFVLNGCLTATGRSAAEDETPGGVEDGGGIAYLSIYSDADDVLVPVESPCLNMKKQGDCGDPVNLRLAGIRHLGFLDDTTAFDRALRHLRARNLSK